jgi:two-component system, cell cycle sensor histidine kinase and response regulator CckA
VREPVYDPRASAAAVSPAPGHASFAAGQRDEFPAFAEDAFCAATLEGSISAWTPAAERLSGYSRDHVIGRSLSIIVPRDLEVDVWSLFERVSGGASIALPFAVFPRSDGTRARVAARLGPLRDASGTITGVGVVFRDISAELSAWEEKFRALRMRALEAAAGGVANELSQILGTLRSGAQDLRGGTPDDGLAQIDGAMARVRGLERDLAAFAGQQALDPSRIALDHMLETMTRLIETVAGPDVEVSILRGATGATVDADSAQLRQAILHLVGSARDAMGGRGNLVVESTVEDSQTRANAESTVCAVIRVSGTGDGLDRRSRKRVFEPFVGTASGTSGLALAAAHGIVRQSGGLMTVESVPGKGTTYTIHLTTNRGPHERTPPRGNHIFTSGPIAKDLPAA